MANCKTEKEFYKRFPNAQSFFEAYPQAAVLCHGGRLQAGGVPPFTGLVNYIPPVTEYNVDDVDTDPTQILKLQMAKKIMDQGSWPEGKVKRAAIDPDMTFVYGKPIPLHVDPGRPKLEEVNLISQGLKKMAELEDLKKKDYSDAGSFNKAFGQARRDGLKTFVYKGKLYGTQLAEQPHSGGYQNDMPDMRHRREGGVAFPQQPTATEFYARGMVPMGPIGFYQGGGTFCAECGTDGAEIMKDGGWIQKAIKHPGRCSHPGDSRCPKGSPQYNLAMRFKHGDLHKKKKKEYGGDAGDTPEDIISSRRSDVVDFIRDNNLLNIFDEEQNNFMQNGGVPDYGFNPNPFGGIYDQQLDLYNAHNKAAWNNFQGAAKFIGATARDNVNWNVEEGPVKAGNGMNFASEGALGSWHLKSDPIHGKDPINMNFGQTTLQGTSGYGYIPGNYPGYPYGSPWMPMNYGFNTPSWSGDLTGMKNMDWAHTMLQDFRYNSSPFRTKLHMSFRTMIDPVTGKQVKVPDNSDPRSPEGNFGMTHNPEQFKLSNPEAQIPDIPFWKRFGKAPAGTGSNFRVGGTYDMSEAEIKQFLAAGGQIEYID